MELVIGAGIALASGLVGYFLRSREFRREQRLRVYGEFVGAFLDAAHVGAGMASLYMQFGETLYGQNAEMLRQPWTDWAMAAQRFEETTARLRIVASHRVRSASEELENFIFENVRRVPPLWRTEGTEGWGEAAKGGPRIVDETAVALARQFADRANREVTLWREH